MNLLDDVKLLVSRHQLPFQTHVLVVLLQVDQLLPHSFDLALDVHPGHVGVIQDFLQPCNVSLYRLPDGHLIVKPAAAQEGKTFIFQQLSAKFAHGQRESLKLRI